MTSQINAPTIADIETLADEALQTIPPELLRFVGNVVIHVEDFPDEETEREMGLESPFDLLGLYRGVDLAHKSVSATPSDLDMIYLYRRPLLDYWCETGEDLAHLGPPRPDPRDRPPFRPVRRRHGSDRGQRAGLSGAIPSRHLTARMRSTKAGTSDVAVP